jgi:hypothetical protein
MEGTQFLSVAIAIIVGIFVLGTILSGFFQVRTAEAALVDDAGTPSPHFSTDINLRRVTNDLY